MKKNKEKQEKPMISQKSYPSLNNYINLIQIIIHES